jgi:mono/diheme cytochrome c family protein
MKRWLCAPWALVVLLACGGEEEGPAPQPGAAQAPAATAAAPAADAGAARAEAEQIFSTRCFTCHGPSGAGDGPGSQGLVPPPRNFQEPAWQDSVTDTHIEQIVMYGGAAVGKSPTMPGNPDLTAKPEVVRALVAHIRALRAQR